MDYFGGPVEVESAPEDFDCGHILMTNAPTDGGYHDSIRSDGTISKAVQVYLVNQKTMMYMLVADRVLS